MTFNFLFFIFAGLTVFTFFCILVIAFYLFRAKSSIDNLVLEAAKLSQEQQVCIETEQQHFNAFQQHNVSSEAIINSEKDFLHDQISLGVDNVVNELKVATKNELAVLSNNLESAFIDKNKDIEAILHKEAASIEQELLKYKESKKTQIDAHINDFLADLSKTVLGKSISLEDHQRLIKDQVSEFFNLLTTKL